MTVARPRIGVLISGRGSNLQAIIEAIARGRLRADLRLVISNRADAAGLARAAAAGVETMVVPHGSFPSREAFDRALEWARMGTNGTLDPMPQVQNPASEAARQG